MSFFRIAAITIIIVGPGIWLVLLLSWLDTKVRTQKYKDNVKKNR